MEAYTTIWRLCIETKANVLALDYFAEALEIYSATYGEKHSNIGQRYNNMAGVYKDQVKHD